LRLLLTFSFSFLPFLCLLFWFIQIVDLRSQQVRDTCQLLIELAKTVGDRCRVFLRDAFPHILEGLKVSNKVMSGYVDECILALIHHAVFKSCLSVLLAEIKDNKSKVVREKCLVRYFAIVSSSVIPTISFVRFLSAFLVLSSIPDL
jgi:hypothetical protein